MAKIILTTDQAILNVRTLIQEMNLLKTSITGVGSSATTSFKQVESAIGRVESKMKKLSTGFTSLTSTVKKQRAEIDKLKTANKNLAKQQTNVQKGMKATQKGMVGLGRGVKDLIAGFGIIAGMQIFGMIIKNSFELIKTFDGLGFAIERISKSSLEMSNNMSFINEIVKDYGVSLVTTTNRYIKFLAAAKQSGITLRDTENIFRSMTKTAGVLGLKTDELRGIYLALEQMLSKGKVTTEELRRQLGERLPGAMGIMAASMKVSISELDKMMKMGQVLSADVLPGFAEAVEVAFGIESVEKIETLVASQNRMTAAWQKWISVIGNDTGFLQSVFNWIGESIDAISFSMMNDQAQIQDNIAFFSKKHQKLVKEDAENVVEQNNKQMESYDSLRERVVKNKEIQATAYGKALDAAKEEGVKLLELQIEYNKKRTAAEVELANERILNSEKEWKASEIAFENQIKRIEDLESKMDDVSADQLNGAMHNLDVLKSGGKDTNGVIFQSLDAAKAHIANLKAEYLLYRKLVETPRSNKPDDLTPDGGSTKVDTSANDLEISRLKRRLKIMEEIRDNEENDRDARLLAQETANDLELELFEALGRKKVKLAKDNTNKITQAEEETQSAIGGLALKNAEEVEKVYSSVWKKTSDKILADGEKMRDEAIANLKLEYAEKGKLTAEQTEEYKQKEKDLIRQYENQILLNLIEAYKVQLDLRELTAEERILIEKKMYEAITKLQLEFSEKEKETSDDYVLTWQDKLMVVGDVIAEIGNLTDAIFEKRIEQINAEIVAEERKYDRLIQLHQNDADKKETLERNKEDAIVKLEKKRLKEEQKQAKAKKAFAAFEIGINTAVAISKASPNPFLIVAAALLGGLQLATVLAAPIPQYKDGLDLAKEDHVAMINDGGKQEYIKRGDSILTTTKKNAVVPLLKGDTVYKDYDEMNKKSILISTLVNGNQINESDFNMLGGILETGIERGFKKSKINNRININQQNNDSYRSSLSRWT